MKKVALFGGAFDPPTVGHLSQIKLLSAQTDDQGNRLLDTIRIIPCGQLGRGDKAVHATDQQRLDMIRTALNEYRDLCMEPLVEDIEVDDTEIAKGRYVPTYEMLDLFAEQHPDEECYVVIGEDQCCRMSHWVRGDWMRDNALFLIMPRKGYAPPSGPLPAEHVKKFVRCPVREDCYIEISSTRVRQWLKEGQTGKVDRYVLPSVLQYIQAHNLYT